MTKKFTKNGLKKAKREELKALVDGMFEVSRQVVKIEETGAAEDKLRAAFWFEATDSLAKKTGLMHPAKWVASLPEAFRPKEATVVLFAFLNNCAREQGELDPLPEIPKEGKDALAMMEALLEIIDMRIARAERELGEAGAAA